MKDVEQMEIIMSDDFSHFFDNFWLFMLCLSTFHSCSCVSNNLHLVEVHCTSISRKRRIGRVRQHGVEWWGIGGRTLGHQIALKGVPDDPKVILGRSNKCQTQIRRSTDIVPQSISDWPHGSPKVLRNLLPIGDKLWFVDPLRFLWISHRYNFIKRWVFMDQQSVGSPWLSMDYSWLSTDFPCMSIW